MGDPAPQDPPASAPTTFVEQVEGSKKFREENGIPEMTEEEAMELAVSETRKVREERRQRAQRFTK